MRALSTRLTALFEALRPGGEVWDLCCDHGLVGRWALRSGLFSRVVFVDQVDSIIARLRENLEKECPSGCWEVHARAAQDLPGSLTGTVVVAGVGGDLIRLILTALDGPRSEGVLRWVLGPHKDEAALAEFLEDWARTRDFEVTKFEVVERGRNRRLFLVDRRSPSTAAGQISDGRVSSTGTFEDRG